MPALLAEVKTLASELALLDSRVTLLETPERNYP